MKRFLMALHFEANVVIEADSLEEAIDKGREQLDKRHVYVDAQVEQLVQDAYARGQGDMVPPLDPNQPVWLKSDPDYINDNDPIYLEEVKDESNGN